MFGIRFCGKYDRFSESLSRTNLKRTLRLRFFQVGFLSCEPDEAYAAVLSQGGKEILVARDVQSVFERKETKYRLSADQYRAILDALEGRLAPDAYGSTVVKSAYFDTEQRDMAARSLEKPFYKEKLRVRGYGIVGKDDTVFVEIWRPRRG